MERRITIQRTLVLNAVRSMRRHVTAEEVYESIRADHPSIGKGTVYRNLKILAEAGEIRRVKVPGGPDRYDPATARHYHVQCVRCGKLFVVYLTGEPDLQSMVSGDIGIRFLDYDIMFTGICPECQK